jgi:superoxide reductase
MAERSQVYKCEACGNIVEVLAGGAGELVCCGEAMEQLAEQTADAAKEKHVPVVEAADGGSKVKVGSVPHPMEPDHYIEWIQVTVDGRQCRQYLEPGNAPEATFCGAPDAVGARSYCNKHGLWKG